MFYTECTLKVFFLCCIQISTSANGHRTHSCAVHGQILWWERAGDTTKTCPVDWRIFSSQARAPVKNIMAMYRERTLLGVIRLKRSSAASREESVKHTRLPQKKFKQRPRRRQRQLPVTLGVHNKQITCAFSKIIGNSITLNLCLLTPSSTTCCYVCDIHIRTKIDIQIAIKLE